MFSNNRQKREQEKEQRRREFVQTEIEDVFGDIMDEMGM